MYGLLPQPKIPLRSSRTFASHTPLKITRLMSGQDKDCPLPTILPDANDAGEVHNLANDAYVLLISSGI